MGAIRQWAFSLCVVMVACGMMSMLLPKTNLDKMFRMAVSVFFMCCLLSPFVLQSPQLRIEVQQMSQQEIQHRAQRLTAVADVQSEQAFKNELEKIVGQNLAGKGINYTDITIHITTKGQNGEAVPVVDIELDREHEPEHQSIRRQLMSELGLEVRLGYG